jgi:hypothetical protein
MGAGTIVEGMANNTSFEKSEIIFVILLIVSDETFFKVSVPGRS